MVEEKDQSWHRFFFTLTGFCYFGAICIFIYKHFNPETTIRELRSNDPVVLCIVIGTCFLITAGMLFREHKKFIELRQKFDELSQKNSRQVIAIRNAKGKDAAEIINENAELEEKHEKLAESIQGKDDEISELRDELSRRGLDGWEKSCESACLAVIEVCKTIKSKVTTGNNKAIKDSAGKETFYGILCRMHGEGEPVRRLAHRAAVRALSKNGYIRKQGESPENEIDKATMPNK